MTFEHPSLLKKQKKRKVIDYLKLAKAINGEENW
jgi:hypothetical protein